MCDDIKGVLETINQRNIDNAMIKRTKTIGQNTTHKTYIEQHNRHNNCELMASRVVDNQF